MKISAAITVSRRPRTDNKAELASVITATTMQMGLKDFDQAVKDLKGAGIVVGESQMTIEASKVNITNNGTTAALFENGKVKADYIDATTIVTEGIKAQTIDAGDATLENLTVKGDVSANSLTLKRSSYDEAASMASAYVPLDGSYIQGPVRIILPALGKNEIRQVFFSNDFPSTRIGINYAYLKCAENTVIRYEESGTLLGYTDVTEFRYIDSGFLLGYGNGQQTIWQMYPIKVYSK